MSYFERYMQGEYIQVWEELRRLKSDIYQEPLAQDAYAVAEELMRRVKSNIVTVIPKLIQAGYYFGYDWVTQPPSRGILSFDAYQDYQNTRIWLQHQPPIFTPAHIREESIQFEANIFGKRVEDIEDIVELYKNMNQTADHILALESIIGTLPLSFRAWYDVVGSVNFVGYNHEWYQACQQNNKEYYTIYQPLFVYPLTSAFVDTARKQYKRQGAIHFTLFPDELFMHHHEGNGAYFVSLKTKNIDVEIEPLQIYFVDYLRRVMSKGGIGGIDILATLTDIDREKITKDLLPF